MLSKLGGLYRKLRRSLFILLILCILLPVVCIVSLRWIDPVTSSVMLQQDIKALFDEDESFTQYQWTDWSNISPQVPLAIIASEDQRFPNHMGIDFIELKKARGMRGNFKSN